MSYSNEIKEEMLQAEVKRTCCSRSFLFGILSGAMTEDGGDAALGGKESVFFHTELEPLFRTTADLIRLRFGKEAKEEERTRPGHRVYCLSVSSKPLVKVLHELDASEGTVTSFQQILGWKCPECRTSYFRGLFLGCGSMSAPQKGGFHLEFRVPAKRAETVSVLLASLIGSPSRCTRKDLVGLYYKKSSQIGDFFSAVGETSRYFSLLNLQIERQIRAGENRATNCVARNIGRTVDAALRQTEAVRKLFETGEIDKLPEELRETARLRLTYREDSLSALAERHDPPITKSGLCHRLQKLVAFAEEISGQSKPS